MVGCSNSSSPRVVPPHAAGSRVGRRAAEKPAEDVKRLSNPKVVIDGLSGALKAGNEEEDVEGAYGSRSPEGRRNLRRGRSLLPRHEGRMRLSISEVKRSH